MDGITSTKNLAKEPDAMAEGYSAATVPDIERSSPVNIKKSSEEEVLDHMRRLKLSDDAGDKEEMKMRNWCSGLPPPVSYLPEAGSSPRGRLSRRSTLADKPELDYLLAATMVQYDGKNYLEFTKSTIHRLSPLWKGAKPIANYGLFKRLIISKDVNFVHADHAMAALDHIGEHVKHLLIVTPLHTSELGDVFSREVGNINTGNDWVHILKRIPNVETVTFEHTADQPSQLTLRTFSGFHQALGSVKLGSLRHVDARVPDEVFAALPGREPPGMLEDAEVMEMD